MGSSSVEEAAASADLVFLGTVVEVDAPCLTPDARGELSKHDQLCVFATGATVRTTFAVDEAWKGVTRAEVVIDTGTGLCCDCTLGIAWQPGERVLIATYLDERGIGHVGLCGGAYPPEAAAELVAIYGHGRTDFPPPTRSRWPMLALAALAALVLVGVALVAPRRGRFPDQD